MAARHKIDESSILFYHIGLMQIENLNLFCDLVETQNFTRAAEKNSVTTSAITQMLHADAVRRIQQLANDSVIELAVCHSIFLHQLPPVQKQFQQKFSRRSNQCPPWPH